MDWEIISDSFTQSCLVDVSYLFIWTFKHFWLLYIVLVKDMYWDNHETYFWREPPQGTTKKKKVKTCFSSKIQPEIFDRFPQTITHWMLRIWDYNSIDNILHVEVALWQMYIIFNRSNTVLSCFTYHKKVHIFSITWSLVLQSNGLEQLEKWLPLQVSIWGNV